MIMQDQQFYLINSHNFILLMIPPRVYK